MSRSNGAFRRQGETSDNRIYHINGRVETNPHHGQEISQSSEQNAGLEPTLDHYNVIVNPNAENSSHTKRRKLTSEVWNDYINHQGTDGKVWAICKHCKNWFDGSSRNGTSHLKKHLASCRSSKNEDGEGDKQADHEKDNLTNPVVLQEKIVINQELNQLDVVRTIIKYGFSKLNLIKSDILHVYQEEKKKICGCLAKLSCRFSLAINWVDVEDEGVVVLTLHFIDDNWELKQKTISVLPAPGEGDFYEELKTSLIDWKFDKNICSVVDNNCIKMYWEDISSWLMKQGSLPFGGCSFSTSCMEDFLTSYYHWASVKISTVFHYIKMTLDKQKLQIAVQNAKSKGRKVATGSIHLSTNYLERLEMVVGFKEAFYELEQIDSDFKPINLTEKEWDDAEAMYAFLKVLNDAARGLSATKYPTANMFFPKICDIYYNLHIFERSDSHPVREVASLKRKAFLNEFWCNSELILAIAVFLDPRFKMDIIERWYRKINGVGAAGYLEEMVDRVKNVYMDYLNASSEMLDELGRPSTFLQTPDLDLYLKEPKIPSVQEFDILNWWRLNSSRYPILAKMARDFLGVPISPAAFSDASLDTDSNEIMHLKGLDDDLKSPLICTGIWLRSSEIN